jgi:hypothetical protein
MATADQVARALNISVRRLQQLVQEGMPRAERGQYEIGPCLTWYIRFLSKALAARNETDGGELLVQRTRILALRADKVAHDNARFVQEHLPTALVREQKAFVVLTLRRLYASFGSKVTNDAKLAAAIQAQLDAVVKRFAAKMLAL